MKGLSQLAQQWFCYFIISGCLYYLFWYLIDHDIFKYYNWEIDVLKIDLIYAAIFSIIMVLVCKLANYLFKRGNTSSHFYMCVSLGIGALSIVLAYIYENILDWWFYESDDTGEKGGELYVYAMVGACMVILILMREYYRLITFHQKKNRELELAVLKSQLEPHFMFNNLSTLDGLIDDNPATAHLFLNKLSLVYRYFTKYITKDMVRIDEDMTFLKEYVALLEMRHPGHYNFCYDKRLFLSKDYIPTMSIQMLTENAIKHNKHSANNPLTIYYNIEKDYLSIKNEFKPVYSSLNNHNLGLNNLCQRCLTLSGKPIIINKLEGYFEVKIPIRKAKKDESTNN